MSDGTSTAGQRVRDPIRGDRIHPRSLRKRKQLHPELYADVADSGSGTGRTDLGERAGDENRSPAPTDKRSDRTASIAADLAHAERQRQRVEQPTASPASETPLVDEESPDAPAFVIEDAAPSAPRARPKRQSKTAVADGGYVADNLLDVVNVLAKVIGGDESQMTAAERAEIEKPLARILSRLDSQVMQTATQFADPVALVMASGAWIYRAYTMKQLQKELAQQMPTQTGPVNPPPTPAPVFTAPSNGNAQNAEYIPGAHSPGATWGDESFLH